MVEAEIAPLSKKLAANFFFLNYRVCKPSEKIVQHGINVCIPEGSNLMNRYNGRSSKPFLQVNFVTCEDDEICQPKPQDPEYG